MEKHPGILSFLPLVFSLQQPSVNELRFSFHGIPPLLQGFHQILQGYLFIVIGHRDGVVLRVGQGLGDPGAIHQDITYPIGSRRSRAARNREFHGSARGKGRRKRQENSCAYQEHQNDQLFHGTPFHKSLRFFFITESILIAGLLMWVWEEAKSLKKVKISPPIHEST